MNTRQGIEILSLNSTEFIAQAAQLGIKRPEAIGVYRRTFKDGETGVEWARLPVVRLGSKLTEDETTKFTLFYHDSAAAESVILPQPSRSGKVRNTLCVSSQIGCAHACAFCETAQMGFVRNLTTAEIIAQWHVARFQINVPVTNVVFMGMGEPLDNIDAVIAAIRVLVDHCGPSVPSSNISVSTAGHVEGIERLASLTSENGFHRLGLAVSINAPNDEIRSRLMPINRASPMSSLMEAMLRWPSREKSRVLIEYVLIPSVNDAPDHADALCDYLRPLACMVNVIPHNPRRGSPWPAALPEDVDAFADRIIKRGIFVKRRRTLGRSIHGACGQLGGAGPFAASR